MKSLELLISKPAFYKIDLWRSEQLLLDFVDSYNKGRPVREQLRPAHLWLVKELLKIYRKVLDKRQSNGWPLLPGLPLPYFRTNNVQLCGRLKRTDRSVQHLRQRLRTANLITDEIWHGSNCSYEVQLNPAILYLQKAGERANCIGLFKEDPSLINAAHGESSLSAKLEKTEPSAEIRPPLSEDDGTLDVSLEQADPETATPAKNAASDTQNFLRLPGNFSAYCNQLQQVTNKLNQLEAGDLIQNSVNQQVEPNLSVENPAFPVENPPKAVSNPPNTTDQGTLTGYETISDTLVSSPPVSTIPHERESSPVSTSSRRSLEPQEAGVLSANTGSEQAEEAPLPPPETVAEAVTGLPERQKRMISRQVDKIWRCAQLELYQDRWIAASEAERGKARLAEYFLAASPGRYEAGTEEICARIKLVRKWIERGHRAKLRRWVPIPSLYFDHRNENGFRATKRWYKRHLKKRAEIADKVALTKAVRRYRRCLAGRAGTLNQKHKQYELREPTEVYQHLVAQLAKRSKALVVEFQEAVVAIRKKRAT